MTDPLQRAIEAFSELCDLPPDEQARRLDRMGGQDPALRTQVEELLLGDREPDARLDRRAEEFVTLQTILLEARSGPVPESVQDALRDRGRMLSHYREEGEVGRGGMGAVQTVWDQDLERRLAMKILVTDESRASSFGRRRLQRFLDEARVTSQLDHPGVVPVHDLGIDAQGRAYFTMKYVKGRTLKEVFELAARGEEGWTQTRVLHVLLRVCEAMSYAHAKGVVHRDLKPTNIMVGRFGEVYVMDWGVARLRSRQDGRDLRPRQPASHASKTEELERGSPVVTMDGTVVGTPNYMSPEQARGGWVDERADVYALGAMLYTLVAGRPPYGDESEDSTPYEVLERVIEGPPPPSRELLESPPELEAICRKAMARAPEERYRDVSGLAEDLRAYLEGRVVSAHRTGAVAELRKWMQRNRALAGSLAAGILVLAAGLAASLALANLAAKGRRDAQTSAHAAELSAAEAKRERARALKLGGLATLDDVLKQGLDRLWPAQPDKLEAYAEWLDKAAQIEALYPEASAELAELRKRALPQSQVGSSPQSGDDVELAALDAVEQELAALRKAQAVRIGSSELLEVALDLSQLPKEPSDLNELAWQLVRPDRIVFGREAEGLALARSAVDIVSATADPSPYLDTLAWGLFANGLDQEALVEMNAAVESARANQRAGFDRSRARLLAEIESARRGASIARLEEKKADLQADFSERRTWSFVDPADQQWHDVLARFVTTFETLFDPRTGKAMSPSAEFGWEITRRQDWARRVEELTVTGPGAARRWTEAMDSIADRTTCPAYRGLAIEPQLGLLPIGRDPRSGLWEFVHLQTGTEPARRPDGTLEVTAESGLVFVLLPGGTFEMGAQSRDPARPNFDPRALPSEGPVHSVTLSPFFLSKFEMTQAQWIRMTGQNPSYYPPEYPGNIKDLSLLHPVERVSWQDGLKVVGHWLGLTLPTEAQWEYAARGGTHSVWWSGDEPVSLAGVANLADRSLLEASSAFEQQVEDRPELNDGYVVHAPIGGRAPNPFGLHDIHGNVWEWCLDTYDAAFYGKSAGTENPICVAGKTDNADEDNFVLRGGSFRSRLSDIRSACRLNHAPQVATSELGLRPARSLERH